jgi:hypothetical protein
MQADGRDLRNDKFVLLASCLEHMIIEISIFEPLGSRVPRICLVGRLVKIS